MMEVINFHLKWRFSMYRFGLIICLYKGYLAYETWKKNGFQPFTTNSVFGEDTRVLMHLLGISITGILAIKMFESANHLKFKRLSDCLFLLSITETAVWLQSYSSLIDPTNIVASIVKMEHFPSSTLYYVTVMLQERYMDAESKKVGAVYADMERIVQAAIADADKATATNGAKSGSNEGEAEGEGGNEEEIKETVVEKQQDFKPKDKNL